MFKRILKRIVDTVWKQNLARSLPLIATSTVIGVLVFALVIGLRYAGLLQSLEILAYDTYLHWRSSEPPSAPPIAIVSITEDDIQNYLKQWPVTDQVMADSLAKLLSYQPHVIGIDIFRDIEVPPGRDQLNDILSAHDNVIAIYKFTSNRGIGVPPPPVLQRTEQIGFSDILLDRDGIVRRSLLYLSQADGAYQHIHHAFALRLVEVYLERQQIPLQTNPLAGPLQLGAAVIWPFNEYEGGYIRTEIGSYQMLLDFRDPAELFRSYTYSMRDLLEQRIAHPEQVFANKIVLLGTSLESVPDILSTPHSNDVHGVELHAYIIHQLVRHALEQSPLTLSWSEFQEILWILCWSLVGAWLGLFSRSILSLLLTISVGFLLLIVFSYAAFVPFLLSQNSWWIPIVPPLLAWLLAATVVMAYMVNRERQQQSLLMNLFARHVSAELADAIWQQREQFLQGKKPLWKELTATIMMTDIVGFTTFVEKSTPGELADWLNEYMEALTPLVIRHHGVILSFPGDAIVAVFGIPFERESTQEQQQDCEAAVSCAIEIRKALIALNQRFEEQRKRAVYMRIGIYTGKVVAGSLGNAQRLDYNIYGDSVNIASRLESYDKESFVPAADKPCRILIGESTFERLSQSFRQGLEHEPENLYQIELRGRQQRITVYRI